MDINRLQSVPIDEGLLKYTFQDEKAINNLKFIIKDILSGDSKAAKREEYEYLNFKQIQTAISWIMKQGIDDSLQSLLLERPYLLAFKDKPPTPAEFLTEKYIGAMSESLWEPMKAAFLEYMDPLKPYRTAALNPSIGAGKAHPLSTKLLDKDSKPFLMGDAKPGHIVLTPYGESMITHIHPQGVQAIYAVKTTDGRESRCTLSHLWTACWKQDKSGEKAWLTVTTEFLMQVLKKYRVEIPTWETRTNIDYIAGNDTDAVYIESIEYVTREPAQCITIEDPRGLYVLENGIITHNSTLTMLVLLYVACCFALMRNPWKFFSMARSSIFVFVLCAVTYGKASEIYREPIQQLIESSSYWKWCRTGHEMLTEDKHLQEVDHVEYLPWTAATKSSVFATGNNLQWKNVSSANSLLGMNILAGAMTEINFFLESGKGWTSEKLMMFFSKLRQRIVNRFSNNYYARFILDSSPSTLEDPIQSWMIYDAPQNLENFIWKGSRWNLYPEEFPDFCEIVAPGTINEKTIEKHDYNVGFQLFKGGNGKPPQICENEVEGSVFSNEDLVWCPIKRVTPKGTANFLGLAKENPIEFMKDYAGIPAGQADRLFYRGEWIEDCFDNGLRNIYGSIVALADQEPEHLIWNQVYSTLFYKILDKWYFYYDPSISRVISVDQSKSRDSTCIAMSHIERDPERIDEHTGQPIIVYVTDFTIMLIPKGGLINLDAIKFFIWDLRRLGNLNIRHVSFDGYQSEPTKQFLKRLNFTVDYISVDSNNDPYFTFYDLVVHNRWVCGKNIFVKNNMKSLYQARRKNTGSMKIDHFPGDLNVAWDSGDWNSCTAGINAKDSTDAIAGNIQLLGTYSQEFVPSKVWHREESYDMTYDSLFKKNELFRTKNSMMI
jgi:hypothetical protein